MSLHVAVGAHQRLPMVTLAREQRWGPRRYRAVLYRREDRRSAVLVVGWGRTRAQALLDLLEGTS